MEAKLLIHTPVYIWEKHKPRDLPDKLKKKPTQIKKWILQTTHLER